MKIVVPNLKPRNHLVVLVKFRKAGAHKVGNVRQRQQRELRAHLKETQ
jgi:hypothetical protein